MADTAQIRAARRTALSAGNGRDYIRRVSLPPAIVCPLVQTSSGLCARLRAAMAEWEWTVLAEHAGVRLDKFLAAPDRLASRARAGAAIERGKVFLNGDEVGEHGG